LLEETALNLEVCRNSKTRIIQKRRREIKTKARKSNPITDLDSPESSRRLRLPDFKTIGT
jgi:hypothetical protein